MILLLARHGSDELDGPLHDVPNATPYVLGPEGLDRAVQRLRVPAPGD